MTDDSDHSTSLKKPDSETKRSSGDDAGESKRLAGKKPPIVAIIRVLLILLVIAGLVGFQFWRNRPEGKPGWLRVNGRIEGYETNVGAKIAGRVEYISNREGEEVKLGQLLVRLSDADIQAQLRGAKARYGEAQQSVEEAIEQVNATQQQVEQARLSVIQSRQDAQGRIQEAEANVATAHASVSQAAAQEVQAKADLELARIRKQRYNELVEKGAVTQDETDQANGTYDSMKATVAARSDAVSAAQQQLQSMKSALMQAKSNTFNPPIRLAQHATNTRTLAQNQAALERAKLDVKNAQATVQEIQANIAYLNIASPIHGVVTARTVEPGAVVAAGQTVISLIDLNSVFLRAYVPDSQIGRVRINQHALVFYDSDPHHGVEGKVIEIDPEASFTPENIYFRDDRVKQVFGIKILIDNPANFAKPGMPADADIDIRQSSGEKSS